MYCFGVSNNSPELVLDMLVSKSFIKSASEVSVIPVGKLVSPDTLPKRKILFIVSIADLLRNLKVLNSALYGKVQVFVFASPLRINELKGCQPLDMSPDVASRGIGFRMAKTISLAKYASHLKIEGGVVSRDTTQYLTVLTDNVKHGSLLTPLMTFIYTLPRATHQTPVKEAIAKFLYGSTSIASLQNALSNLLTEKNLLKLISLLETDVATAYRSALKAVKTRVTSGDKPNLASICKQWNTNDYEIKYILSIIEGMKNRKHLRGKSMKAIHSEGLKPSTNRSKPKPALAEVKPAVAKAVKPAVAKAVKPAPVETPRRRTRGA